MPGEAFDEPLAVRAAPLDARSFAPFGDVIEHRGSARRHMLAFSSGSGSLRHTLCVTHLEQEIVMPATLDTLERHPHSDQAFIPLNGQPYLVVVCDSAPDGSADVASARAFVAAANQGVVYRRNVWHHGLSVLAAPADFVVVIGKSAGGEDDVFRPLPRPIRVLPPLEGA